MIRRAFSLVLAVLMTVSLGSTGLIAQGLPTAKNLNGRSIDAAGRAVAGQRVELMKDLQVLAATTSSESGEWSFSVAPGDYVVRMNINGKIAGIQVSVVPGIPVTGTLIVVPAAAASPQIGTLASLLANLAVTTAATVSSVALSVGVETETTELDPETVVTIINALQPAERLAFAQQVLEAIAENDEPISSQLTALQVSLHVVVATGGTTTVPPLPPVSVSP